MRIYQCEQCDYQSVQKKQLCPRCRSPQFNQITIPDEGRVYSYTIIRVPPLAFIDLATYHVVLVEMSTGLKVTGMMREAVQIGDSVRLQQMEGQAFIFTKAD